MVRKKSNLWLHMPKKQRKEETSQLQADWDTKIFDTNSSENDWPSLSQSESQPTPKKRRLHSPSPSTEHLIPTVFTHYAETRNVATQTDDITCYASATELSLFDRAIKALTINDAEKLNDIVAFLNLIAENKYPLNNIAFLLFLETVKFFNGDLSSEMRYRTETKRFWKNGYKLFHSKFLYFMGGPKNIGQINNGTADKGKVVTEHAEVNFIVPSVAVLTKFSDLSINLSQSMKPGVLHPILDALHTRGESEFMLCADAKKVTAGVDKVGGDVDVFGHEDGLSLETRKDHLKEKMSILNEIKGEICNQPDSEVLQNIRPQDKRVITEKLKTAIRTIGSSIKDGRELQYKQELGLKKFKTMGGEKWRDSRYVYVISQLQASLYQLREFTASALSGAKGMGKYIAHLHQNIQQYPESEKIDMSFQENALVLVDDAKADIAPQYIKQRSVAWTKLREEANVTGSTLNDAIGMRGLKKQKEYFAKVFEGKKTHEIPVDVQRRMDYGSKNEKHGIATLLGYVIPIFFPDCYYIEEGCYFLSGQKTTKLLEVSPDGSIRKNLVKSDGVPSTVGDVVAAVEVKCPFPSDFQLPVHYTIPDYYVCQCLAEMVVLKTQMLIYVSFSKESTTFFRVDFDKELWNLIYAEMEDLYDLEDPLYPKNARPTVKVVKDRIREFVKTRIAFLGEFLSLEMIDSGLYRLCNDIPFKCSWSTLSFWSDSTVGDVSNLIDRCMEVLETGYNLLRKKATEIMVWVLTNKHRNSKLEIPCSVPIAYGLKDYRLTNQAFRNATENVLKECKEHNLRILSFATDGQWIQNMVRDGSNAPLTIYELQKDVWDFCRKMPKAELVKQITSLNVVKGSFEEILANIHIEVNGLSKGNIKYLTSKEYVFDKIVTSSDPRVWNSKKKPETDIENDQNESPLDNVNTDWLPEEVISAMQEEEDMHILSVVDETEREIGDNRGRQSHEAELNDNDKLDDFFSSRASGEQEETSEVNDDLIEDEYNSGNKVERVKQQDSDDVETMASIGTFDAEFSMNATGTDIEDADVYGQTSGDSEVELGPSKVTKCDHIMGIVLCCLSEDDKIKKNWNQHELASILRSKSSLPSLTHKEIDVIFKALYSCLPTTLPEIKTSWRKNKKLELLSALLGTTIIDLSNFQKKEKTKSPKTLRQLAIQVIQSKKYPKAVLSVAYASYLYPARLLKWKNESTVSTEVKLVGFENDVPYWFSHPELNTSTGEMLSKSLDCSHNLTHLRVLTCKNGVANVSSDGWRACARSNATSLSLPLVEDIIDKQSVPNARTHFSQEVENWQRANGFEAAADFTKLVRNWYEASDSPGIPAIERVQSLIEMRKFLLRDVDFGIFPPTRRYINGIPIVTFQGMCIDIDTKLQLHGMTNTYNIRSVGSLAAETTVGVLQTLNPVSQVSIKARDVPALMVSVMEVMTCKINTDRGFYMRTSKLSGVYPMHEADSTAIETAHTFKSYLPQCKISTNIIPRNNSFDKEERRRVARDIKFGSIAKPNEPSRGGLPVRQWHRKDETKILPTKRLGLLLDD